MGREAEEEFYPIQKRLDLTENKTNALQTSDLAETKTKSKQKVKSRVLLDLLQKNL